MSLTSGREVVRQILGQLAAEIAAEQDLQIHISTEIEYSHDSISIAAVVGDQVYPYRIRDFLTRQDLYDLKNLEPEFIRHKFCRALNILPPRTLFERDTPTEELKPSFSLSELEQAQDLIDKLSCQSR